MHRFINKHTGKKAIVMGLGESTNLIIEEDLSDFVTIGVNDISRVYDPMYVVTVDMSNRLGSVRSEGVINMKSQYLFTQIKEWEKVPKLAGKVVLFKLGSKDLKNLNNHGTLDFSCNSPYIAVILAYQMGCREIGLIGVDFTDNHCHTKDGVHELVKNNRVPEIDRDYARLGHALAINGCTLRNLSASSKLTSLPKMEIKEFLTK